MKLYHKSIPLIFFSLFAILIFSYSQFSPKIPVSYWDEMQWVGQSYLYQFYTSGNFNGKIWVTFNSLDQPTLAKFSYGAWLYPKYLAEKKHQNKKTDYTKYLISNGLYFIDADLPEYTSYYSSLKPKVPEIQPEDTGFTDYYVKKYGKKINNTLNVIFQARKINFVYLALAVLLLVFFLSQQKGFIFSALFAIFYGFNSLIMRNGIKAHSDALFLFLFNASLILLFYYFLKKKFRYLVLFSIFTGLAMSTKLNGIMLYFIFIAMYLTNPVPSFWGSRLGGKLQNRSLNNDPDSVGITLVLNFLLPLLILLSVFIILNPSTYSNPPQKIIEMYKFRAEHTKYLAGYFPEINLPTPAASLMQTFQNFYDNRFIAGYNLPIFLSSNNFLGPLMLILFLIGIHYELKLIINRNKLSLLILSSFIYILLIMSFYLHLNWDRYFIHLVFFFIYYQVASMVFIINRLINFLGHPRFSLSRGSSFFLDSRFRENDTCSKNNK